MGRPRGGGAKGGHGPGGPGAPYAGSGGSFSRGASGGSKGGRGGGNTIGVGGRAANATRPARTGHGGMKATAKENLSEENAQLYQELNNQREQLERQRQQLAYESNERREEHRAKDWRTPIKTFIEDRVEKALTVVPKQPVVKYDRSLIADYPDHLLTMKYDLVPYGPMSLRKDHPMGQMVDVVELKNWYITDASRSLKAIVAKNRTFTSLDCSGSKLITDLALHLIAKRGDGLLQLNVSKCPSIGNQGLTAVAVNCPSLTDIDLSGSIGIGDASVVSLAQQCHGLLKLDISNIPEITDAGLTALSYGCPALKLLNCRDCRQVTDIGVKTVIHRCNELDELDLSGCHEIKGKAFVEQPLPGGSALVRFHQLKKLHLCDTPELHPDAVTWLLGCFTMLTHLEVPHYKPLTDSTLCALGGAVSELNMAWCSAVTDAGIFSVCDKHWRTLTSLNISHLPQLTAAAVSSVLSECRALEKFAMDGLNVGHEAFACQFPANLHFLNLHKCPEVGNAAVARVSRSAASNLTTLSLGECGRISDQGVCEIADNCTNLETLDLSRPHGLYLKELEQCITDDGIHALLSEGACTSLTKLNLDRCTKLEGACFSDVPVMPSMTSLSMRGCIDLSVKGVERLIATFPRLVHLDISEIPIMNNELKVNQIVQFVNHRPYVKLMTVEEGVGFWPSDKPPNSGELLAYRDAFFTRQDIELAAIKKIIVHYRAYRVLVYNQQVKAAFIIVKQAHRYFFLKYDPDYNLFKRYYSELVRSRMNAVMRIHAMIANWRARKDRRASIIIQKYYRGYRQLCVFESMLEDRNAAMRIQALWRGYVGRCVNILKLLALEKDWDREKRILGISDADGFLNATGDDQTKLLQGQLNNLRNRVGKMLLNGNGRNAGPIPPVPRRFGTEPLTSLALEHSKMKLPVYGGKKMKDFIYDPLSKDPTHMFGEPMFPPEPLSRNKPPMNDFAPHQIVAAAEDRKGFAGYEYEQIHDPYYPPLARPPRLACERCNHRIALVTCAECALKYCLTCDHHVHSKPALAQHLVVLFNMPEQPSQDEKGLIPNMVRAARAKDRLEVILNSVKSKAELRKIEEAIQLEKELEEEAERERKAAEYAAAQSKEKHDSASRIAAMYRRSTAIAYVQRRRERAAEIARQETSTEAVELRSAMLIQEVFRGFVVRNYLHRNGIEVRKHHKLVPEEKVDELHSQIDHWFQTRRVYERTLYITNLLDIRKKNGESFRHETRYCENELDTRDGLHKEITSQHDSCAKACKELTSQQSSESPPELALALNREKIRSTHWAYIMDISKQELFWHTTELRQGWRRHAYVAEISRTTKKHLEWLQYEAQQVDDLMGFVKRRISSAPRESEHKYYREWLADQKARITKHRISFDMDQDYLMIQETFELKNALEYAERTKFMLRELVSVLHMDSQFNKEKTGLELARAGTDPESDESVEMLQAITALKKKQQFLREETTQKIRYDFEQILSEEDKVMLATVLFKNDEQGIAREMLPGIKVMLKAPRPKKKHLIMFEWIDLYRSQPWLAKQEAEEQRNQMSRDEQQKEIEKNEMILARQNEDLQAARDAEKRALDDIAALEKELEDPETPEERRYTNQLAIEEKRRSIDEAKEDMGRRSKQVEKREAEVSKLKARLEKEEADAKERLAKQYEAKEAFEKREAALEKIRMKKIREELAIVAEQIQEVTLDLDGIQNDREKEQELADEVATLTDQMNDPKTSSYEKDFVKKMLLGKQATLVEMQNDIDTEEITLKEDLEDLEERQMELNNVIKSMSEREERMQKFKDAAANEERMNQLVNELRDEQLELRERRKDMEIRATEREAREAEEKAKNKEQEAKEAAKRRQEEEATSAIRELGVGSIFGMEKKENVKITTKLKHLWRYALTGEPAVDHERVAMMNSIQKHQKIKAGQVEAIRQIQFTVGSEETQAFASAQSKLSADGMPHFRMIEKGIGMHDQIQMWVEPSMDQDDFITDIQFSSNDPDDEGYQDLSEAGYFKVTHNLMHKGRTEGGRPSDPDFAIWCMRNPAVARAIADLTVSYSEKEEHELMRDEFEKVPTELVKFHLAEDMFIWFRQVVRTSIPHIDNPETLLKELKQCRKMIKDNPDDDHLKKMEDNLKRRLEKAHLAEDEKREMGDHPFKYSMEFLAMDGKDVTVLLNHFEKMDTERKGTINVEMFYAYIGHHRNRFTDLLFKMLESTDGGKNTAEGNLDFGEFTKALGTFCFFGKEEMLRYMFAIFDLEDQGTILHVDLLELLTDLHPDSQGPVTRALKEVDIVDGGKMTYDEFADLHVRFPFLLYPGFHIQDQLRRKFLGLKWWERKLRKYALVKSQIQTTKLNTDKIDALDEAKKARADRKQERFERRKQQALESQSTLRRTLIQAQMMADLLM